MSAQANAAAPRQGMLFGDLAHQVHEQGILIHRAVGLGEDRCEFELVGSDLIVSCFHRNPQQETFPFELLHISQYTGGDSPEIVILELLPLGRLMSQERTPSDKQVRACSDKAFVD